MVFQLNSSGFWIVTLLPLEHSILQTMGHTFQHIHNHQHFTVHQNTHNNYQIWFFLQTLDRFDCFFIYGVPMMTWKFSRQNMLLLLPVNE